MAKRKRSPKQVIVGGLVTKPEPSELERLAQAGESNLQFLEQWAETMPTINGVPVVKALTYELIQILNRACLRLQE